MRTVAELIRNVSLVRKVWLENVVRVAFNTTEEAAAVTGCQEILFDDLLTTTTCVVVVARS